jgi:hypothetical protein
MSPAASGGGSAYASAAGSMSAGRCDGGGEGSATNKPDISDTSWMAFETFAFLKFTPAMMNRCQGDRL